MDSEVYVVDLNEEMGVVLYGGGDDRCTAVDLEGEVVAVVEDFRDSVVFCRFVDAERFVVGTLDGSVLLMTLEEEIYSTGVDQDISKMVFVDNKVLVGTAAGDVHVFSADLSIQNVCIGLHSEIKDLTHENGKVYALSESRFAVFDVKTHQKTMDVRVHGGSAFDKMPASDVVCLGMERCIVIRKDAQILSRVDVEGTPECVLYMNNYFVVAGDFEYVLLINMPMGMRTFRIPVAGGVSLVKGDGQNRIAFGTYCGLVGHGDIRDEKSFRLFEGGVGTVFDLCFRGDTVYVGGETGFNVLDISAE